MIITFDRPSDTNTMDPTHEPSCSVEVDADEQLKSAFTIDPPTDTTDEPAQQSTRCGLFELSGELRNLIYRHALVKPHHVTVTGRGPGEPALLRVCRTVRTEATPIYYIENRFNMQIEDYDGASLAPFVRQHNLYNAVGTRRRNLSITYRGAPNFENLVEWIKAYRHGAPLRPANIQRVTSSHDGNVLAGAWKLCDTLRKYPWEVTELALEAMFRTLKGAYSLWNIE